MTTLAQGRIADKRRKRQLYEAGHCRYVLCPHPREPGKVLCARHNEVAKKRYREIRAGRPGRKKSGQESEQWLAEVAGRIEALAQRAKEGMPLFPGRRKDGPRQGARGEGPRVVRRAGAGLPRANGRQD